MENNKNLFVRRYAVLPNCWYKLNIGINIPKKLLGENNDFFYKKGILKICIAGQEKNLLFPIVKLPNVLFTKINKIQNFEKLSNLDNFIIIFKTKISNKYINLYFIDLSIKLISLIKITESDAKKEIDLWRMRRLYDLEFINYYLENLYINYNTVFVDRFQAEFKLFKNNNYFEPLMTNLKLNLNKSLEPKNNILYLIDSNILYERNGYTIKNHNFLNNFNKNIQNKKIFGVTKYGYPFDRPNGYYKQIVKSNFENVNYIRMGNKDDNFNNNNLIDYLKKYILETIKIANNINAGIIHSSSNYLNGIACFYAAKYLGIKSIYDYENTNDNIIFNRPEIYDSNFFTFRESMEKLIMAKCNKIITCSQAQKNILIKKNIHNSNINIINFGIDTDKYSPMDYAEVKNSFNLKQNDIILGYIGTLEQNEGIQKIIDILPNLSSHNLNYKFILIGDGNYKNDIMDLIKKKSIDDNLIYFNNLEQDILIKYMNLIDIGIFVRLNNNNNNDNNINLYQLMSIGKPIIVSNIDDFKENCFDNINCCVIDDAENLLDKIIKLHNDNDLKQNISKNAREWIIDNYSFENVVNKLINVYNSL